MTDRRIHRIIGTGGIGKGIFFCFRENSDLGRNESRMAELTEAKDYCKLHIVFHYLARLLSSKMQIIPIGKTGDDAYGDEMINMMQAVGMDVSHVYKTSEKPTMISVCFQYPDKSGGNITSDNSACEEVDEVFVLDEMNKLNICTTDAVIALPEVPLNSRITMLKYAKNRGAYCAASCGSSEIEEFCKLDGPSYCDMLALNQDETKVLAGIKQVENISDCCTAADKIHALYPNVSLWLTCGSKGSILADMEGVLEFEAFPETAAVNTGGAGDASLAGLLAGLFSGESRVDSGRIAVAAAALSVECADSINEQISWDTINSKRKSAGWL